MPLLRTLTVTEFQSRGDMLSIHDITCKSISLLILAQTQYFLKVEIRFEVGFTFLKARNLAHRSNTRRVWWA